MAALPYMPLFVADYLADAAHLTTIQHGAYLLLIMNYWQRGEPLPNDDAKLARIAGLDARTWKRMKADLQPFFVEVGSAWVHSRIDSELARVEAKSLKCKKAGLTSAQRRLNGRSTGVQRPLEQTFNHTDTDTSKKETNPPSGGKPYVFEGQVIRLQKREYQAWAKAYPDIDLMASLQSRDDWFMSEADDKAKKRWFISTSNHLANLQQKASAVERAPVWDGMP